MIDHPAGPTLHPLMAKRWSPRALDPTHHLHSDQLAALLEASRWAPSASNSQPWRFAVTTRGAAGFDALLATLADGNRHWAQHASALVAAATEHIGPDGTSRPWAVYDTGQAVAHLSLQAAADGLVTHQMGGFDAAAVAELLQLPDTITPLVVIAVGRYDEDAPLGEPLRARDAAQRLRQPVHTLLLPIPTRTRRRAA